MPSEPSAKGSRRSLRIVVRGQREPREQAPLFGMGANGGGQCRCESLADGAHLCFGIRLLARFGGAIGAAA